MRVLIIGSNGCLGKTLINYISNTLTDWEIIGVDIKSSKNKEFIFKEIDISSPFNWVSFLNDWEPDIIFHLAGIFHNQDTVKLAEVNTLGFLRIVEGIRQSNIDPILLIVGSAAEYGKVSIEENPIKENHKLSPQSMYGYTKKWQEEIALYYFKTHGIKVICTRPSNFIGRGLSYKLLPGYLNSVFRAKEETVTVSLNSKEDIRDYIDVRDVASALVLLAKNRQFAGEVFNISTQIGISNLELVKCYENVSKKKTIIRLKNEKNNDQKTAIWLSNQKIRTKTSWKPKFDLKDTVSWILSANKM